MMRADGLPYERRFLSVLFLCFLVILLASCGKRPGTEYRYVIATDGEVFVYSRSDPQLEDGDLPTFELVVADKEGNIKRLIKSGEVGTDLMFPTFGEKGFYYVKLEGPYDRNLKSTLMKCSLEITDCHPLVTRMGGMGPSFELDDGNVVFLFSSYVEDRTDKYGWLIFQFYRFDIATGTSTLLKGVAPRPDWQHYIDGGFGISGPVYRFGQTLYFNLGDFSSSDVLRKDKSLHREVGRGEMRGDKIYVYTMKNEFTGENQLRYHFLAKIPVGEKAVYKLSPESPFTWQVCVIDHRHENDCPNRGRPTTYPVIRDGKVYYGLWNKETRTMHFESIEL